MKYIADLIKYPKKYLVPLCNALTSKGYLFVRSNRNLYTLLMVDSDSVKKITILIQADEPYADILIEQISSKEDKKYLEDIMLLSEN